MILMWLGPFVLMLAGLEIFRRSVGDSTGAMQVKFLTLKPSSSIAKMLLITKFAAAGNGSLLKNQYSAVALLNLRGSSRRFAILLLCMSGVGAWTVLVGILLAWQLSGFYLLSFAGIAFLIWMWTQRGQASFQALFGLGLFLVGAEWTLRQQSVLFSLLGESEFHFLLADGRWTAQLVWMVAAIFLTAIIGFEFWSVLVALVLLVAGSLSLNGAIALICGELLAHVWLLWWRSRKLNPDTKMLTKFYALSSTAGILIGFIIAGFIRDVLAWEVRFEANQMVEKSLQLAVLFLTVMICKTMGAMIWGHFAAQHETDEVQAGAYFSVRWWQRGWIATAIMMFVRRKLWNRSQELENQVKEFDQAQGKLPAGLLQMHTEERQKLAAWLQESDKSREKF